MFNTEHKVQIGSEQQDYRNEARFGLPAIPIFI
jgi:hypothetical protein